MPNSYLPQMPLVEVHPDLRGLVQRWDWFHKIDFGDLVTPGYDYDAHWNWVARLLQAHSSLFPGTTVFEHGPADGLWSCWLAKLGCARIVAADMVERQQYRLVIESFGLPVEYHPNLISTATPSRIRRLFDGVVSLGVLYHTIDPLSTLIMYQRYIKKGGFLILETGSVSDDSPLLYYTGEGLIYGKEGGNHFVPAWGFLQESLTKSLGFEILAHDFRRESHHELLRKEVGRTLIVAVKQGLPKMHHYPVIVEEQLGMGERDGFGPIEWAYGDWVSRTEESAETT